MYPSGLHCVVLVSLLLSTALCFKKLTKEEHHVVGFYEGARRTVKCADGGHFKGFDLQYSQDWAYDEAHVSGMSIVCTNDKLNVEFEPESSKARLFGVKGKLHVKSVVCPDNTHIQGLMWRFAKKKQEAELRVSGVTLVCAPDGEGKVSNVRLDSSEEAHDHKQMCTKEVQALDVWYGSKSWNGAEITSCL